MSVPRLKIQLNTFAMNSTLKNVKSYKIILTTAKCTSNLGKHPSGDGTHNVCGAFKNYKENSSGMDYVFTIMCQYFFECHSNKKLIQPKIALNLILIECNQFIKARPTNPISIYLKKLIRDLKYG